MQAIFPLSQSTHQQQSSLESTIRTQPATMNALLAIVYNELRDLAGRYLKRERIDHTLQPTALVHEVYLKLARQESDGFVNRAQFLGIAAQAMRRILVDHARKHGASKRGSDWVRTVLDDAVTRFDDRAIDLLILDEALERLAKRDPQLATIVEMRFFGGLTNNEIAEALEISERTVRRDWATARAWLRAQLNDEG